MAIYSFMALFIGLNGFSHDFHVSVCDMEYDAASHSLKVTQRIFVDDFEEALNMWSHGFKVDLLNPRELEKQEKLIELYMKDAFEVEVNDKPVEEKYLGSQIENDVIKVYISIDNIKKLKSIKIKQQVLMELFLDQINLVHFKTGDFKESFKFDLRNQVRTVELDP